MKTIGGFICIGSTVMKYWIKMCSCKLGEALCNEVFNWWISVATVVVKRCGEGSLWLLRLRRAVLEGLLWLL